VSAAAAVFACWLYAYAEPGLITVAAGHQGVYPRERGPSSPAGLRRDERIRGGAETGHRNKSVRFLIMRVINVMPLMMRRSASVPPEEKP